MKSVSGKELARALERRGWTLLRIHGSHHIYGKQGSVARLSVPITPASGGEFRGEEGAGRQEHS